MLTKQYWLIGVRRMVGLFAFFYACLHFTTYIWLDKFFDLHEMWADILKRKFITVGFSGVRPAHPAGSDVDGGMDPAAGWHAMAAAASIDLYQRHCRGGALCVAGQRRTSTCRWSTVLILAVLLGYRIAVWASPKLATHKAKSLSEPRVEVPER